MSLGTPFEQRLDACLAAREIGMSAMAEAVRRLVAGRIPATEVAVRNEIVLLLRQNHEIFPRGWYIDPPNGVIVAAGTPGVPGKLNAASYRPRDMWASEAPIDLRAGMLMLYCSPVYRKPAVIGDGQLTVLFGGDQVAKSLLIDTLKVTYEVFAGVEVGMTFAEVVKLANEVMGRYDLTSALVSTTDPTAGSNVGHTIPGLSGWTPEQAGIIAGPDWGPAKELISSSKRMVSDDSTDVISPGMGFTFEPRAHRGGEGPPGAYHSLFIFDEQGRKRLVTGFDPVFAAASMDYMPTRPAGL